MKLLATLPANRSLVGTLVILGGDADQDVVAGPFRCRGKADGQIAARNGNPSRDPLRPFGDHPDGVSRVIAVQRDKPPARAYGPAFVLLSPVGGPAYQARLNGREGLALHGGALNEDGTLRSTEGCLRLDHDSATRVADLLDAERTAGREVFYECRTGIK